MTESICKLSCILCAVLVLLTEPAAAQESPPPPGAAGPVEAIIIHTGSTNRTGHAVFVQATGQIRFKTLPRGRSRGVPAVSDKGATAATISANLSTKLFADIAKAGPLAALTVGHCPKSASFGSSYYLQVNQDRSPDLDCPGGDVVEALKADVKAILSALPAKSPGQ